MDSFVDERDYNILENDKYTFFMLGRIMDGKCELLLTDHRHKGEEAIRNGSHFLWRNAEGRNVSVCSFIPNGGLAGVGLVYTREEYRRKHYAENLVYQVTQMARDAGYMPMLYTDADYTASNVCYEKIGYVLKGKLCTIG